MHDRFNSANICDFSTSTASKYRSRHLQNPMMLSATCDEISFAGRTLTNIFARDEPGGNRNSNIKINAQHNVRKRAI